MRPKRHSKTPVMAKYKKKANTKRCKQPCSIIYKKENEHTKVKVMVPLKKQKAYQDKIQAAKNSNQLRGKKWQTRQVASIKTCNGDCFGKKTAEIEQLNEEIKLPKSQLSTSSIPNISEEDDSTE